MFKNNTAAEGKVDDEHILVKEFWEEYMSLIVDTACKAAAAKEEEHKITNEDTNTQETTGRIHIGLGYKLSIILPETEEIQLDDNDTQVSPRANNLSRNHGFKRVCGLMAEAFTFNSLRGPAPLATLRYDRKPYTITRTWKSRGYKVVGVLYSHN